MVTLRPKEHNSGGPSAAIRGARLYHGLPRVMSSVLAGAAFVPASRALLDDPVGLLAAMSRHGVTIAMFTPSYLHLLQGAAPDGLRCLLTAGERPMRTKREPMRGSWIIGISMARTEVCGTICMFRVDPNGEGPLPSGRPLRTQPFICWTTTAKKSRRGGGRDSCGGLGVARGYLNQPDLTADRFVANPYGRAYRSNDLGRLERSDGISGSLGPRRRSGQSLRTIRVPGRNRAGTYAECDVRFAAAMQQQGRLIAFVESAGRTELSLEEWHRFLSRTLPGLHVALPGEGLSKMPVDSRGKVDRQALLALAEEASRSQDGADRGMPPQGKIERQIAGIWEEILGVRPIMREDNFYALGGTSLLSIAISQRLHDLGYAVPAQTILVAATVAGLAERIAQTSERQPVPQHTDLSEDAATAGQEDFWIGWKLGLSTSGSVVTRVLAVRGKVPELDRWQAAWTQLVARHTALRTAFFADADGNVLWRIAEAGKLASASRLSLDCCDSPNDARERIAVRSKERFVLTEPPLARAGLVQVSQSGGETLFWFALHHSMADGYSAQIIQEEMHYLLLEPGATAGSQRRGSGQSSRTALSGVRSCRARPRLVAQQAGHLGRTSGLRSLQRILPRTIAGRHSQRRIRRPLSFERLDASTVTALSRLAQSAEGGIARLAADASGSGGQTARRPAKPDHRDRHLGPSAWGRSAPWAISSTSCPSS